MLIPGRHEASGSYRYGFNGMEKDDEIKGDGNSYDFGARMYDSRIGRWMSIDPLHGKFPFINPFNYALNNAIVFIDPDGKKVVPAFKDKEIKSQYLKIKNSLDTNVEIWSTLFEYLNTDYDKIIVRESTETDNFSKNEAGKTFERGFSTFFTSDETQIVFNNNKKLQSDTVLEEFFHSYQIETDYLNVITSTSKTDIEMKLKYLLHFQFIHQFQLRIEVILPKLKINYKSSEVTS